MKVIFLAIFLCFSLVNANNYLTDNENLLSDEQFNRYNNLLKNKNNDSKYEYYGKEENITLYLIIDDVNVFESNLTPQAIYNSMELSNVINELSIFSTTYFDNNNDIKILVKCYLVNKTHSGCFIYDSSPRPIHTLIIEALNTKELMDTVISTLYNNLDKYLQPYFIKCDNKILKLIFNTYHNIYRIYCNIFNKAYDMHTAETVISTCCLVSISFLIGYTLTKLINCIFSPCTKTRKIKRR